MTPLESIYAEPEKWKAGKYHFVHEDGFAIWIANGPSFCKAEMGGQLGYFEKRRYWRAFKWWRKHAPITKYTSAA